MIYLRKLFSIAMVPAILSTSVCLADDKSGNRESQKLKAIPVEELPVDVLTEIYFACVSAQLSDKNPAEQLAISESDVRQTCQHERGNLSAKIPPGQMDALDSKLVSNYKESLRKEGEK